MAAASPPNHYENFPVGSWLCPPRLRPAVHAIYAYARTADDIADEGDAPPYQRLSELAGYRIDLAYAAEADGEAVSTRWPQVFGPLREAIAAHRLPVGHLAALLDAFCQDTITSTYADRPALLDYCRRSADPVGRLLLHLYGIADDRSLARSDAICSALQLANFWQDLSVDTRRGRLYVPLDDCARFDVDPADLLGGRGGGGVAALVAHLVAWARDLMRSGAPLVHDVPGRAGWELRLVVQGGLRILDKVERLGPRVLGERPTIGAGDALPIAWRALTMRRAPAIEAAS